MNIGIITGSSGLIGGECVSFFAKKLDLIIGIDDNSRQSFFGSDASTVPNRERIIASTPNYKHYNEDIRNELKLDAIFAEYSDDIQLIIHCAAQPSHDWAANAPTIDFTINANGTLNLLESFRKYCPKAKFIYTSTNKVYGDLPNNLPFVELEKRWELDESHAFHQFGIDESMSVDQSTHSLFGVSKLSADLMVQEYARYFGLDTIVFRGGCLTGSGHAGTQMHGFLSYLMKCTVLEKEYTVFGYKGKQVRDNIHSSDLVNMFWHYYKYSNGGSEVYNVGGSRHSNCSMLEAIEWCQKISGKKLNYTIQPETRKGDHQWYISDISKFRKHYPNWEYQFSLEDIFLDLYYGITKTR